ncbi:helix-turn-helix transcriptional regulator [Streptomyces crystallinus]|uniref:HTH cro/C1-type domain-containing protein n=1 Tax=Streptomyces crystallinus TaxID=68191 RepID=A0ABN1GJ57_9ACTN
MDADVAVPDELDSVWESIKELLTAVDLTADDVIDFGQISQVSGLPEERIRQLLQDPATPAEDPDTRFRERLARLRDLRRRPDGRKLTLDDIGTGIGCSHAQVGYLLNGERQPSLRHVQGLELFFRVSPGFFTATDRQSLARALEPVQSSLAQLAVLKGHIALSTVRLRGSTAHPETVLGQALAEAIAAAEPDAEVREVADAMRALPPPHRSRVASVFRGILGLTQERPGPSVNDR